MWHRWDPIVKIPCPLKGDVSNWAMESSIIVVLNIRETLIPGEGILGVLHLQNTHDYPIGNLCLAISLGVEGSWFGEMGIQQ